MTLALLALLAGIRLAESSGDPLAVSPGGWSKGAYQLNERFHTERARFYGEYNPFIESQARRVAAGILEDNFRYYLRGIDPDTWTARAEDLALSAYRRGRTGTRSGIDWGYVCRVRMLAGE